MTLRKIARTLTLIGLFFSGVAGCGGGSTTTNPPPPTAHEVLFADGSAGIQAFSIDNGLLTPLASTSDADLSRSITGNMLVAASGKFLLVTDSTGSHIKVFSINQKTGSLTPVSGSPFAIGGQGSGSLAMDPSGKYLYAPYLNGVAAFTFDIWTGALTVLSNSPFSDGSSPFAGAVDHSGAFLYTTGSTVKTGLSVYTLNSATGALTPVAGSPFATPLSTGPYNLVAPADDTLYATVPNNNAVLGMRIDSTSGTPSQIVGSPFSAVDADMFVGLDSAGKFLYTCNANNGTISAFTVDSTSGTLTPITGTPFGLSDCSTTVAVDPSGKFLYAANPGANSITGLSIVATTGALTMLNGSPFTATDATLIVIVTLQ